MMEKLQNALKRAVGAIIGALAVALLRIIRLFDPVPTANFIGWMAQRIGPWLPEHRIGRANLTAAFPEKSAEEIDAILMKVWDNLGRVAAEYAQLDRIWDLDRTDRKTNFIEVSEESRAHFWKLHDDGKGALIFAAHLANWELPALAGPAFGVDSSYLFRPPNIASIDTAVQRIRGVNMGKMIPTTREAPFKIVEALERGSHVGMLVDQYFGRGVDVTFFGRTTKANPMLARLARQVACPIYGVRMVRLPNNRFRGEISEEIAPVRDASGEIDIQATTQRITSIIEGWIRENPEQWLWLHRRWR
jgi:Kdo2-lipid IVA lauroyltransferase/acyltransferase